MLFLHPPHTNPCNLCPLALLAFRARLCDGVCARRLLTGSKVKAKSTAPRKEEKEPRPPRGTKQKLQDELRSLGITQLTGNSTQLAGRIARVKEAATKAAGAS